MLSWLWSVRFFTHSSIRLLSLAWFGPRRNEKSRIGGDEQGGINPRDVNDQSHDAGVRFRRGGRGRRRFLPTSKVIGIAVCDGMTIGFLVRRTSSVSAAERILGRRLAP
jgi:hypothetical protein